MKKILGIIVLSLLLSGNTYAEIIFKNCNLSPNTGMTDFYIYLEKGEIEIRDQDDIRIFAIDDNQNSKVSSSRLIGWPSMSEFNNATRDSQILFLNSTSADSFIPYDWSEFRKTLKDVLPFEVILQRVRG